MVFIPSTRKIGGLVLLGYGNTFLGNEPSMTGNIRHSTDLVPLNMGVGSNPPLIYMQDNVFSKLSNIFIGPSLQLTTMRILFIH